ncbi:RNA-binding ATPase activator esf2 [Claviceps africana]|uniref:18S rRNA factor 2 n=1 Tax=Claviceps africana TaxID=83212 RepID=A0A8K0NKP7_9HYPO|nr:RNA-binding ATPase activator esf2 [Claviceps africana]
MPPEKKNNFLDVSDSEDDQQDGYNSDDEITKGGRSAKRRKVDSDDNDDDDDDASDVDRHVNHDADSGDENDAHQDQTTQAAKPSTSKPRKDIPHLDTTVLGVNQPLAKKNLVTSEAAIKKSGVVYISRVPPGMKPSALRALLSPYGKLNRIFLAPEDPSVRARRKKAGGNKRVLFTEGWIEFLKKKEAKAACELLNGQNIGGKKGSFFRDDVWNLVYLKGFKWFNLTEQITAENAERTSRMRAEISKATKENKAFVRNVEKAKMLDGMQAKAKKRKAADDGDEGNDDNDGEKKTVKGGDRGRTFRQVAQVKKEGPSQEQPEHVTRVLSKIF